MVALGLEMRIRGRCETQVARTPTGDNECEINFVLNQLLQFHCGCYMYNNQQKGHMTRGMQVCFELKLL